MGNKYKLLDNLLAYFPKKETVDEFIDLFGGSGVVSINVPYEKITYNEINHNITNLFKILVETEPQNIIGHIKARIQEFDLPQKGVEKKDNEYSKYKRNYLNYRKFYNKQKEKNYLDLYTLTYFSFSNLIRFNSKNEFNMPFGNRCFLFGEHDINIELFYNIMKNKSVDIQNKDAFEILYNITKNKGQFIYLDPPYANTMAIYNESRAFGGWGLDDDHKLFDELDRLDKLGVRWAMSNVLENKGIKNEHIESWAIRGGYKIIDFENKTYAALGKGNAESREVLIINYEPPFERYNIFDFMEE
jgi:DNA adenine methylase Dam